MQHDFYLQYSYQRMTGALDEHGNITGWTYREVTTPIRPVFRSPEKLKDPKEVAAADLNGDVPYEVAHFRADYAPVLSVVPRAWWRSVSSPFQVYAIECFLDELAHAAGEDPVKFRLRHLRRDQAYSAKLRAVLELAAQQSGWGNALPVHQGRGVACCLFGETAVAHVAEVSVEKGAVRVNRVVSAVHCGLPVNPDSVRAQIEGGINYALTPVLQGEINIKQGGVEQSNFHDYKVLRMRDAPDVDVHLVPAEGDPSSGVGEAGVPPLAPAVANALFAATGQRVRRLPLAKAINKAERTLNLR